MSSREDYNWATQLINSYDLHKKTTVTFSPVIGSLPPEKLAAWILEDRLPVRLRLQLHTILWADKTKGY
jgi:7-carboxy-7-deazaguanine synthase